MAAPKRNKEQVNSDRTRVSELMMQQYSHSEIAAILAGETGIQLSRRQITYDVNKIRQDWLSRRVDNYDAIVSEELERLNVTERLLWDELRHSKSDKVRRVVEQLRHGKKKAEPGSGEVELEPDEVMFIARITETIDKSNTSDIQLWHLILDCQKERRKIRGAYAPTRSDVDIHKTTMLVKGYASVSPDDWDDPIEGVFEENKSLGTGN